ncbi:unnamed protein product [Bathycoccus prasinos]
MRLRVRSPLGVTNLTVVSSAKSEDDDPTLNDLCSEIIRSNNSIHTNNKHRIAEIRFGFGETQRTVNVSNANTNGKESLKTLGISDGETITVKFTEEEEEKEEEVKEQKQVGEATGFRNNGSGFEEEPTPTTTNNDNDNNDNDKSGMMTEEAELVARAVEASMLDEGRMRAADSTTSALDIDDDGTVAVRKVIDADNSCLFNAIGYVFFRSLAKATELRKVVHDAVLSDPDTFSEAALGKPPKEYAEWVLQPNSWGGQVELFVLSTHLRKQIAAYDVQTGRVDVYGEDRFPRSERGHLIYDGLHYDALVFAYPGLEDVSDTHVTVVDCSLEPNSKINGFDRKARALAKKDQERRLFTDVANFSLRCLVCQTGLVGENEAREHAKNTGHTNFGEY